MDERFSRTRVFRDRLVSGDGEFRQFGAVRRARNDGAGHFDIGPGAVVFEQVDQELVVERMAGTFRDDLTDDRGACQIEIANAVENFVTDELVLVAQPVAIEHGIAADDDRIVERAAACESRGAKGVDLMGEPECAGAGDVRFEGAVDQPKPLAQPERG